MIPIPEELEAQILRDPEDRAPYLVLGDLLESRGDPRGELIAVQAALEEGALSPERAAALRAREVELLAELRPSLLGVVDAREREGLVELVWRRGFLHAARLPSTARGSCGADEATRTLAALLSSECPAARFLSALRLGPVLVAGRSRKPARCEYAPLAAILGAAPRPGLRTLVVGDFVFPDEVALANARLGSLAPLSSLGALVDLTVQGSGLAPRLPAWPGLRRLALRLLRLERKQLEALLAAPLAELEELELWLGAPRRGAKDPPLRAEELAPLFDRARLPRLRTLRLLHAPFADELAALVARSSLAPGLERLDLCHGTLSGAGALALAEPRLGALRELALDGSFLRDAELAGLRAALPAVALRVGVQGTAAEARAIGLARWGRTPVGDRLTALLAAVRARPEEAAAAAARIATDLGQRALALGPRAELALALREAGELRAARELLEDLLAVHARRGRPAELAWARGTLALVLDDLGERARADALFAEALAGYRALEDREKEAWLLGCLAGQRLRSGDAAGARTLFEQALAIHRAEKSVAFVAHLLGQLGALFMQVGKLEEARAPFAEAVALLREQGNERELGKVLGNLAGVHWQLGEWDEVERLYGEAIALSRRLGDRRNVAYVLANLALSFLVRGQLERVEAPARESLSLFRATGHRQGEAWVLGSVLGPLATGRNQLAEALQHLEAALAIQREAGERRGEGVTQVMLGNVFLDSGALAEAERRYREGLAIAREVENAMSAGDALEGLAACEAASGRLAAARVHCEEAIDGFRRIGWRRGEGGALLSLGRVQHLAGARADAEESYRHGLELQREVGNGQLIARTLAWLGVLLAEAGRLEAAGAALAEAERVTPKSDAQAREQVALGQAHLEVARARASRDPRAAHRLLRAAGAALATPAASFEARELQGRLRGALAEAEAELG